ncbi:MAG: ABC transporter permease [Planctomycetaceae bacterium]
MTNIASRKSQLWKSLTNEYGMVLVLLFLVAAFSVLTLEELVSTGADAGREVARIIADRHGSSAVVVVVTAKKDGDEEFASAATTALEQAGLTVAATTSGSPPQARKAIESALAEHRKVDAVATTGDAARWTVFDRIEGIGSEKCVSVEPSQWPKFAKTENILNVANQTAVYAIVAIGMTLVIITAGIDLSVGSLIALSAVTTTAVIQANGGAAAGTGAILVGCLAGLFACAAAGFFSGTMITLFRVPPFIVTLAAMLMARGLARRITDEESISDLPETFRNIAGSSEIRLAGIEFELPNPVILMIMLYVVAHLIMSRTVFGRYVYAVGGNAEAARLSGVGVKRITLIVYTLCGTLAGLGGILQASKLSGDPKLGVMFELDVIAAVVVGGTSLMGGQGRIIGTLIGALIIAVIKNGMNLMKIGSPDQQIVLGAVILLAVLLDMLKRRGTGS